MEPHRHHIIPKFYLKGFTSTENPKMVWAFRRDEKYNPGTHKRNNPALQSPTAIAWEEDFYAIPRRFGPTEFSAVETEVLAKAEFSAIEPIEKLRKGYLPNHEDREILAYYIILLWRRVKSYRSRSNERWPASARPLAEQWRLIIDNAIQSMEENDEYRIDLDRIREMVESFGASSEVPKEIQNNMLKLRFEKMEQGLLEKKWVLLINKTRTPFITSDSPVYFPYNGGLKRSDLTLPFSKDVALWASSNLPHDAVVEIPESKVRVINRRSLNDSDEYAFASIKEEWILKTLNKTPYHPERLH